MGYSTVYITKDCSFRSQIQKSRSQISDNTQGTFLFAIFDVTLYIHSAKFYDGLAYQGGALYISGDATVTILASEFKNNYAQMQGGAIYGSAFT